MTGPTKPRPDRKGKSPPGVPGVGSHSLEDRMTDELPLSQAELRAFMAAHDGMTPLDYLESLDPRLRASLDRLNGTTPKAD